jgi:hypothetical protein
LEKDQYECYAWAKKKTGFDPMKTPTTKSAPPAKEEKVMGAGGSALIGGGAGAIIGGVAGGGKDALAGGLIGGTGGAFVAILSGLSGLGSDQQKLICAKFFVYFFGVIQQNIHLIPKFLAVVFNPRVQKLMQNGVVDQLIRQAHQVDV